jgi:ElaB/YqjD/DUF883 family membrane-anchored ribosome-binding protein
MPKFQARFYNDQDESIPCRVDPVEAPDHGSALREAHATMRPGEVRVELLDVDDEFRRGTPDQAEQGLMAAAKAWDFEGVVACAINMFEERSGQVLGAANSATAEVKEFVGAKPYAAIGIAAALAYVVGLHVGAGRRRVIYLKPER